MHRFCAVNDYFRIPVAYFRSASYYNKKSEEIMNLGISISMYLERTGDPRKAKKALQKKLGVSDRTLFTYRTSARAAEGRLPEIAEFFKVKVSELIEAGEG